MNTIAAGNNVSLATSIFENNSDAVTVFDDVCYSLASPKFRLVWKILVQNLMVPISFEDSEIISVPGLELWLQYQVI